MDIKNLLLTGGGKCSHDKQQITGGTRCYYTAVSTTMRLRGTGRSNLAQCAPAISVMNKQRSGSVPPRPRRSATQYVYLSYIVFSLPTRSLYITINAVAVYFGTHHFFSSLFLSFRLFVSSRTHNSRI